MSGRDTAKMSKPSPIELVDMHCHLDFFASPLTVAKEAAKQALSILAVGVTPEGYKKLQGQLDEYPHIRLAAGAHPWWIADNRCTEAHIDELCRLIEEPNTLCFVAECGLDFSDKHTKAASHDMQLTAFRRICSSCARAQDKILSIHAVRSASAVLDILEQTGSLNNCTCIFHWFSGSSSELVRAVKAGCYFSINEMMLATKRSREYVKIIPTEKLLLESDLPPENPPDEFGAFQIRSSLERTLVRLAEYRAVSFDVLAKQIGDTSKQLLCLST